MSDDYYTVVFNGHPKNIPGNIFDHKSDFGSVAVISVGDAVENADAFRVALEAIAENGRHASEAAQKALDEYHARLKAALDRRSAK